MAKYDFKCPECDNIQEVICSISERETIKVPCSECSEQMEQTFIAANFNGQFVLRGEWAGKTIRESNYRRKRSEQMKKRQRDNHLMPTLAPNVGGEQAESWSDAKKLAKDKGHDTRNYDAKVNSLAKGNT